MQNVIAKYFKMLKCASVASRRILRKYQRW